MKNLLNNTEYNIMEASDEMEDANMPGCRYHNFNTIYLYGVFENSVAARIEQGDIKFPITLFESISAAKEVGKNIQNPVLLRFAVNTKLSSTTWMYDAFEYNMDDIAKKMAGTVQKYKDKCSLIRSEIELNSHIVIVYKLRDKNRIVTVVADDSGY